MNENKVFYSLSFLNDKHLPTLANSEQNNAFLRNRGRWQTQLLENGWHDQDKIFQKLRIRRISMFSTKFHVPQCGI